VDALTRAPRNARTHSAKQIKQIAASIRQFGFVSPILIDTDRQVIAGHGRLEAAKQIGMTEVPTVCLAHMNEAQRRAYRLADNRLAELGGWDRELLVLELSDLTDLKLDFEVEVIGWDTAEIDQLLCVPGEEAEAEEACEPPQTQPVARLGELWHLGRHRVLCGNARDPAAFETLRGGERAQMVFTDPPYNVPVQGHVSGLGKQRHREFAMECGEMDEAAFTGFLATVFTNAAASTVDGAIHFVCMDWRHMGELLTAGRTAYIELKNLCVWNKDNGGMGSFYRSKHELVFVFKCGTAGHINNFGLGESGRYRTNVWDYAGANTFRQGRDADLAAHPTVKPAAMVMDAIKDCSRRDGVVLDAFGGSGTTLIAAERTGWWGYLLEIDPLYVDVTIRRWQMLTGQAARLAGSTLTFDEAATERLRCAEDGEGCHV